MSTNRQTQLLCLVGLVLGLCCGCAGSQLRSARTGSVLSELPAAPYRIAVAPPPELPESSSTQAKLQFAYDVAEVQSKLVAHLEELNTSTQIIAVFSADREEALEEARTAHGDLLLLPTCPRINLAYQGLARGTFISAPLWGLTWITSMWVDDCSYLAHLVLKCEVIDVHSGKSLVTDLPFESKEVCLDFWGRNPAWSLGLLESMFVPGFWTHDNVEVTSSSLTAEATYQVAGQICAYFKEAFPKELLPTPKIDLHSPNNQSHWRETPWLYATVTSVTPITEVSVYVNDERVAYQPKELLPPEAEQQREQLFVVVIDQGVTLTEGEESTLRVEIAAGDAISSKTLAIYRH